ncbi:acetyltransferase [Glutamicibacter soli]|uniref:Ferrous iron transport protein A n=1 Tax=Glutamicibacter soli TaxID=453836 RepID=A0A365YQJ1_9MICC|nr:MULTISPECIES: hypothetical protein [Micrococcaceae]ALD64429.1 hypothetical protein AFL94_11445 [Arthrobacter sp. LS16]ALQ30294.1 hypothetical protein ATC04_06780 [Arthrobacter sp. YC-RL1]KLI88394.1 hypothetical protein AA310_11235 [Arthrobacter sp. YC-RL1]NAZ14473.1 ferrous iron transport protein A [Glutamicibacter soli]RBM04303.1 ferrous iron transport protein A [Glutamicibacter soli]
MLNFNELTTDDRIVLRYRLATQTDAGESLTDALGTVLQVSDTQIVLQTRSGPVAVRRSAITHAKRIPPAPVRRSRSPRTPGA